MPRETRKRSAKRRGTARRANPAAHDVDADAGAPVARGTWSGSITFGLVTVPVELFSATRRGGVPMRMLGPDGVPLQRRYVCPKEERELADDEIERGYEVDDGKFVLVTDDELEALAPRRSRDIEITRFVPRDAIDPAYFVCSYYLIPDREQSKAYHLLAETMERTGRAAIASFVMRGKAYAVAIVADDGILRAETLRFGDELRTPESLDLPKPGKAEAKRVSRWTKAIDALAAKTLDPQELADESQERLLVIAREKQRRGEVVEAPVDDEDEGAAAEGDDAAGGAEVVDLVALIRDRLRAAPAKRPKRAAKTSATKPRSVARRRTPRR